MLARECFSVIMSYGGPRGVCTQRQLNQIENIGPGDPYLPKCVGIVRNRWEGVCKTSTEVVQNEGQLCLLRGVT